MEGSEQRIEKLLESLGVLWYNPTAVKKRAGSASGGRDESLARRCLPALISRG